MYQQYTEYMYGHSQYMYGHTFILGILFPIIYENKKKIWKDNSCYLQNEVNSFPSTTFFTSKYRFNIVNI